jgi:dihydroneopterin aldolase/2-amino-4-hydroxy-6-hydroxymethyldihydropteridine diphosphokinase
MSDSHLAYLSLGSNIQPEVNLVRAIQLLKRNGDIEKISNVWESKSVGAEGPNYLNVCVSYVTLLTPTALKKQVLLPIEGELGRKRTENKFAPRTMDIDIVIFDDDPCDDRYWDQAFVIIPLAEIYPDYKNPLTHESLSETATRLRTEIWMETRQGMSSQLSGNQSAA